jgi:hypothetical protein
MQLNRSLLMGALRDPDRMITADSLCWETVLTLSRRHGLAGRWLALMESRGAIAQLDADVSLQLQAEARFAGRRSQLLGWETTCAARALASLHVPVVLLKGAAYLAAGLPHAATRVSADLDILVPHAQLDEVEAACHAHGWRTQTTNAYDDAYFRRWMHELPPMQHVGRGTVIDIHHNILPLTAKLCPNPEWLLEASVAHPDSGLRILQPVDMLLHSIVHGFHDGEFSNALRDVLDVHEIASFYSDHEPDFWPQLAARARAFGFQRPTALALSAAELYFGLKVPMSVLQALASGPLGAPLKLLFEWSLHQIVVPGGIVNRREQIAARLLQARAHLHKMPVLTLAKHLSYKTWVKLREHREHDE